MHPALDQASRILDDIAQPSALGVIKRTIGDIDYDAVVAAILRDRLHYFNGLRVLRFLDHDIDKWNAEYKNDRDEVLVQRKFEDKDELDKVRTLLHEAGHRGHFRVDKPAWRDFQDAGLDQREHFLATANQVHLMDFGATGEVEGEGYEVFAESYARWCLDIDQPEALNEFWRERRIT